MKNPIFRRKYKRLDVVYEFAKDFSTVTITKGDQKIVLDGHAIADVYIVMCNSIRGDGDELTSERLFNFTPTSMSLPECKW